MTFQELEECKVVFKKIMKSVHHVRIEYPEEEKTKKAADVADAQAEAVPEKPGEEN